MWWISRRRWAQEAADAALLHCEAQVVHRQMAAVPLHQIFYFDHGLTSRSKSKIRNRITPKAERNLKGWPKFCKHFGNKKGASRNESVPGRAESGKGCPGRLSPDRRAPPSGRGCLGSAPGRCPHSAPRRSEGRGNPPPDRLTSVAEVLAAVVHGNDHPGLELVHYRLGLAGIDGVEAAHRDEQSVQTGQGLCLLRCQAAAQVS